MLFCVIFATVLMNYGQWSVFLHSALIVVQLVDYRCYFVVYGHVQKWSECAATWMGGEDRRKWTNVLC